MDNNPLIKGDEVRYGKFIHLNAISKDMISSVTAQPLSEKLLYQINNGREPVFPQSAQQVLESFGEGGGLSFAVCLNTDDTCIGASRLGNIVWQARHAQLVINIVDEAYLTTEILVDVLQTTLQFAYWEANLNRIYTHCLADNELMQQALEQAGFVLEGHLRQEAYRDGQYLDIAIYSMLQHEWSSPE